jgi:hypothetical protein
LRGGNENGKITPSTSAKPWRTESDGFHRFRLPSDDGLQVDASFSAASHTLKVRKSTEHARPFGVRNRRKDGDGTSVANSKRIPWRGGSIIFDPGGLPLLLPAPMSADAVHSLPPVWIARPRSWSLRPGEALLQALQAHVLDANGAPGSFQLPACVRHLRTVVRPRDLSTSWISAWRETQANEDRHRVKVVLSGILADRGAGILLRVLRKAHSNAGWPTFQRLHESPQAARRHYDVSR